MSLLQVFRYTYHEYLPIVAYSTTVTSFYIGVLNELTSKENRSPAKQMMNIFSTTCLGSLISISYPISLPVFGLGYAYKISKNRHKDN